MTASKILERKESSSCFSKIYQSKIYSDFTIISNAKRYEVYKGILASSIPYFEKMFTTDMIESKSNEFTIDGPTEALGMIIAWSYYRPITLTSDNARELAELADYMSIPELIAECLTFLSENSSNSILSEFSYFIDYNGTRRMVERYMCSNFCDIASTDEFLSYDFETIDDILSFENLNIENELDVFDAIIKWIAADPQHRLYHLSELMKKIHWISFDKTTFMDIASNNLVKSCEAARKILNAAFYLIAFGVSEKAIKHELIGRPRQNLKRFSLRFDTSSKDKIYFKTLDQPQTSICLKRADLNGCKPKFFEANLADYTINSSQVIRIDWKNRIFQSYDGDSQLFSTLFGYFFTFETQACGKVTFCKGSALIELGEIPDDYPLLVSIFPYKGHFYIVVKEKESEYRFKFRIAKFDPIKNIWTNLSSVPEPMDRVINKVMMKIKNGKVSLLFGQKQDYDKNLFMSNIMKHWIYNINDGSWSENEDFVLKAKSDPEIVKNLSNEIKCFEDQIEILKSTLVTEESC